MLLTLSHNPNTDHLRTALVIAVLFHLLLAAVLPDLPSFKIPAISRNSNIDVFLQKTEETKPFEQTLDHPVQNSDSDQPLQEPALAAAQKDAGEEQVTTEAAPQQQSVPSSEAGSSNADQSASANVGPVIRFDRAYVKAFAEQETIRFLERNKEELERFKHSFNSTYSYQRRSKINSYKSQYGDYHMRSSTSAGDICFLLRPEPVSDEFSTNTVYFYRCGKQPQGLEKPPSG